MAGSLQETRDLSLKSPEGREITGIAALGERLERRLSTTRGTFPFWPTFGTNLVDFLLAKTPPWQVASAVKDECEKDEQVDDASVEAAYLDTGRTLRVFVLVISPLGNFTFTMTANDAAATLVALQTQ